MPAASCAQRGSTLLNEGEGVRKDRVMLRLSRGGADATIAREFDLDKKAFVPAEEGGFVLPEAKSQMCYKDRDTLLVGGVFGEAEMTDSGYPRTVYEWKRGTPLEAAKDGFTVSFEAADEPWEGDTGGKRKAERRPLGGPKTWHSVVGELDGDEIRRPNRAEHDDAGAPYHGDVPDTIGSVGLWRFR